MEQVCTSLFHMSPTINFIKPQFTQGKKLHSTTPNYNNFLHAAPPIIYQLHTESWRLIKNNLNSIFFKKYDHLVKFLSMPQSNLIRLMF